ncbi:MAG TPA: hypothetical protein DCY59_11225 [Micrococcaceae bacterium]|nr:hypothetical protein [Micrococcaceae bacterium]
MRNQPTSVTVFKHGDPVRMRAHTLTPHTTGTVTGTTPEGRVLVRWDDNHAITEQVPHYLTPLGEPMSKTFKAHPNTGDGRTLEVSRRPDLDGVRIVAQIPQRSARGIIIQDTKAPALALAILDAAPGPEHVRDGSPEAMLAIAQGQLRRAVDAFASDAEAKAQEAADQAELETEALALYRCTVPFTEPAWGGMSTNSQQAWVEVARKAREMHNR